jgi:hypothetical protein
MLSTPEIGFPGMGRRIIPGTCVEELESGPREGSCAARVPAIKANPVKEKRAKRRIESP